jgi:hypothetical protein
VPQTKGLQDGDFGYVANKGLARKWDGFKRGLRKEFRAVLFEVWIPKELVQLMIESKGVAGRVASDKKNKN